jgi:hypothetical protein
MLKKLLQKHQQTQPITFTDTIGVASEYAPKPAIHFIPDWYKKMEAGFPKEQTPDSQPTIKKCIPVLDAMTAGYIIVSPCDVYVSIKDGEPNYNAAMPEFMSAHPRKQAYKHPKSNDFGFPKFQNPWTIKTPKGYSCLFVSPMHNQGNRFVILEGIVDTDNYPAPVNFPFVLKTPTEEFLIPAGTPIAQVIPFKRDKWQSEFFTDKQGLETALRHVNSRFFDRYKHMFWERKSYSQKIVS